MSGALPKRVSIGNDATYLEVKEHVLANSITSRCVHCQRHYALATHDEEERRWYWETAQTNSSGQFRAFEVICCALGSYWARWHETWKRRLRNQRKNRIRKLKR